MCGLHVMVSLSLTALLQPTLRSQSGATLSTGGAYTANGPLVGAIAYLQTGSCGANGEGCTLGTNTFYSHLVVRFTHTLLDSRDDAPEPDLAG